MVNSGVGLASSGGDCVANVKRERAVSGGEGVMIDGG